MIRTLLLMKTRYGVTETQTLHFSGIASQLRPTTFASACTASPHSDTDKSYSCLLERFANKSSD
jgi:hypothetical protein